MEDLLHLDFRVATITLLPVYVTAQRHYEQHS